jgi:hypothetical protein
VLEGRGLSNGILIVGGSSLLLLGLISRPTADLDVIGLTVGSDYVKADHIPQPLAQAVADVAVVLELAPTWLNNGPASLMDSGLPAGYEGRTSVRRYSGLEVHIPARVDLICFKLYAAVDQGPGSKHFHDLQELAPTAVELLTAASWCQSHDPSSGFESEMRAALADLTSLLRSVGDDDADS